ncbi:hypothetical protein PSY31_21855, partial [Shigella flexneri]|nr:hypothetical protein [Shigella flexneri]
SKHLDELAMTSNRKGRTKIRPVCHQTEIWYATRKTEQKTQRELPEKSGEKELCFNTRMNLNLYQTWISRKTSIPFSMTT